MASRKGDLKFLTKLDPEPKVSGAEEAIKSPLFISLNLKDELKKG